MENSKELKIGAALSYFSIALNIAAGLLYTPWMIEQIGRSQYGLYTLSNSLITLFLIDFGLSAATARYVSKYRAENRQDKIDNFLGAIYKLYLLIDSLIFTVLLVIFFFLDQIYVSLTPEELSAFKVVYVISAIFSVTNFPFVTLNGILTAYEQFIPLKLADVIYRIMVVGLTIIALLCGMGLYALVTINAFSGLAITLYKFIIAKKKTPVHVNFSYSNRKLYKDIFGFSVWMTVASLAQRMVFNITPSILGVMASSAAIAVFGIVVTIEGYTYTLTNAINGMFMPRISRICSDPEDKSSLNVLTLNVGRFQYAVNSLIIVGFAVVGRKFLILWVGEEFIEAYWGILLVLIPGLFYNSLEIANTAMVVQKKVKYQAFIALASGAINIVLCPFLAKIWGVMGACVSIFIAYIFRDVVSHIIYYRVLKINILKFMVGCYLKTLPILVISLFTGFVLEHFFVAVTWINLIIEAAAVAAVFGILTILAYKLKFLRIEKNM